jgi:uncharacterized protein (TIGR03437 family)
MNRAKWLILILLVLCGGAWAQSNIASVIVGTTPVGAVFSVDGVNYSSNQTFLWPQGSKHIVTFIYSLATDGTSLGYQLSNNAQQRFTFSGWMAAQTNLGGGAPSVTVTADPTIPTVIATLQENFLVQLQFPNGGATNCPVGPGAPTGTGTLSGVVYFNGSCIATSQSLYAAAGPLPLLALPYPGWVFYGWEINGNLTVPSTNIYNIIGPVTITPLFSIAKRVHFMTNPPGLTVLVDRSLSQTPVTPSSNGATCPTTSSQVSGLAPPGFPQLCIGDFDFLPYSVHTIGANTPQQDQGGNYWVFEGYTNGIGQNGSYTVDAQTQVATTLTAGFVPGVKVTLITSQPGLQLTVDGRSNWQGYNFVWGQGETHTISAPATQVDSQGRTWSFVSWSNGGAASQTLTMPTTTTNLALTANFAMLPQVTINSVPAGMQFSVDGNPCGTPCVVSKASGSTMQVAIPASVTSSSVSRLDLTYWNDGSNATTRTITFNQSAQTFIVTYHSSWALTATVNPAASATLSYNPPTPDGFFPDGTQVTVTVTPNNGFKFVKWGGDFSGNFTTGYLSMTGPHAITAYTQAVPYIAPAGIMSAAGATPDGTMAPGSVISIYGNSLAPALQVGSTNPLPQSLGSITVTINNYLLPLLFVSPTQINAQLPSELVDGNYTLLVHQTGQPDVSGALTVSRDAPAMFTQTNTLNQPLVLALHADGTLVTFDSPALRGEQISIYGTGFGPYSTTIVDGFFVPPTPATSVADPVILNVGAVAKTPDFAGAAPGFVGMTLVQMTITDDLPTATTVNLTVTVNAKQSTTVVLPLQ